MKLRQSNRNQAGCGDRLAVWALCVLLGVSILAADKVLMAGGGPNVTGAKLYIQQNQLDDAMEVLEKELETVDDKNEDAWYLMGYIYARRQQYDLMIEAFNKAVELKPKYAEKGIKVSKDSGTKFHSSHGVDKIKKVVWAGEFNAAVNAFNGAISATEEAQVKEQYAKAIGHFDAAIEIMPDSTGAHRNLAAAYINMGDYDGSIKPLQDAMERNPDDKEVKMMLAKVYASTNRDSLAIPILLALWESGNQDEEMADYLSRSYLNLGKKDEAMEIYKSALAANPDNMNFSYNYGIILLEARDYTAAIERLTNVYEKDPDFGDVTYNLGAAYLNRGVDKREALPDDSEDKVYLEDFRSAFPYLEDAIISNPDNMQVWFTLGRIAAQIDKIALAQYAFAKGEGIKNALEGSLVIGMEATALGTILGEPNEKKPLESEQFAVEQWSYGIREGANGQIAIPEPVNTYIKDGKVDAILLIK